MSVIPLPVADRIGKLLPRLASPYAGEVAATGRAIERTLASAGLDLNDLAEQIRVPTSTYIYSPNNMTPRTSAGPAYAMRVQALVLRCRAAASSLSSWEVGFLGALDEWLNRGLVPTPRQIDKLGQVARKVGLGGAL